MSPPNNLPARSMASCSSRWTWGQGNANQHRGPPASPVRPRSHGPSAGTAAHPDSCLSHRPPLYCWPRKRPQARLVG